MNAFNVILISVQDSELTVSLLTGLTKMSTDQ